MTERSGLRPPLTRDQLAEAWDDVLAGDREDGQLSASVLRYHRDSAANLDLLAEEIAQGTFVPSDMSEVLMSDGDSRRLLHVPAVRDRVVERALLDVMTPYVDPWLGPTAYAYRPGLGVADAVQAVANLRDEGLGFVLRTDVDDCFPSIPVALSLRLLGALVPDDRLMALVHALFARAGRREDGLRRLVRGLPLGGALSPMLANLVLAQLDDALLDVGFALVRYADDLVVVTASMDDAWEAARVASDSLRRLGMSLGADKTEVMSFDDGFCFLGEDFGPRYPPALEWHRVVEPDQRVLYVSLQGCRVRTEAGRVVVESADDAEVLDVPTGHVSRVVCFGSVGFSAGARNWAMSNEVDVVFVSRRGSYLGHLLSGSSRTRVLRLRAQLAACDDEVRSLRLAKAIVEAKVRKQIVVLQRFGRRQHVDAVQPAVRGMRRLLLMVPACATLDEVRGVEGAAAREYFPAFGSLFPDELSFTLRSRQPPLDLANSGLSFLYAVLLGECTAALAAAGLDASIGALHADHETRPSLALDLMEEFRPLIVDQVVLTAARKRELRAEHGWSEPQRPGVLLTKAGRGVVIDAYERRMLQTTRGALPGFSGTLRRHVYRQAQRLVAVMVSPTAVWTGLSWR